MTVRQRSIILVLAGQDEGLGEREKKELEESLIEIDKEIEKEGRDYEQRMNQLRKKRSTISTLIKKFGSGT